MLNCWVCDLICVLLLTDASGFIKFWHYTSGSCLHTIDEQRQTLASAIDPAGSMFLTSGSDPGIHVYDEKTKQLIRKCEPRYNFDFDTFSAILWLLRHGVITRVPGEIHRLAVTGNFLTCPGRYSNLGSGERQLAVGVNDHKAIWAGLIQVRR